MSNSILIPVVGRLIALTAILLTCTGAGAIDAPATTQSGIADRLNACAVKEREEFFGRAGGVADGEDRERHASSYAARGLLLPRNVYPMSAAFNHAQSYPSLGTKSELALSQGPYISLVRKRNFTRSIPCVAA